MEVLYGVAIQAAKHTPVGRFVDWAWRHGDWAQRGILAVAVYFLAHALFLKWPVFSPNVLILWSLLVALAAFWQPNLALLGFLLGFAPSLLHTSGALALVFAAFGAFCLAAQRISDSTLKLALFLSAPLAFQHGWFFFAALVIGLSSETLDILPVVFGTVFALFVNWLSGQRIPGVLPPHAPLVAARTTGVSFSFLTTHLQHPRWSDLVQMASGLSPYAVTLIAVVVLLPLVSKGAHALRASRRLRDDALAIGLASLVGLAAWAMVLDGFHPSLGAALRIAPETVLAGIAALLLSRLTLPRPLLRAAVHIMPLEPRRLRTSTWDDVAGYEDVKRELMEAAAPYTDAVMRRRLEQQGLPLVRGILLYGPPGTGKTLFTRVLASEAKMDFISVSGPEFFSKWVGDSEAKLRDVFRQARGRAPSLLFFDELESFLPPRDQLGADTGGGQVSQRVVSTFLSEMDGLMDRGDVLVVAATNDPDQIDPAAIRPGRFDQVIFIPPPDREARRAMFLRALRERLQGGAIDIEPLVQATERYTAADIFGIVANAYRAATHRRVPVTQDDLLGLFHQTKPTVSLQMLDRYERLSDRYGRRGQVMERSQVVTHDRLGWDDIGGMEDVKAALREAVELPLLHHAQFKVWGVEPHKGILLYGPPGCGKTMFAKVVSDTAEARFYTVNGPELIGGAPGAGEERLRQLFERARENRPSVVFFDELDAIAGHRAGLASVLQGSMVQQLLTLLDGRNALNGVVVIAATNRPDQIDPALLRPGRFDRLIYVPLPDAASRTAQWRMRLRGKPGAERIDCDALSSASQGYSGAEIQHVANRAALDKLKASVRSEDPVADLTTEDVLRALMGVPRQISPQDVADFEAMARRLSR